jgi:hypothetical protein
VTVESEEFEQIPWASLVAEQESGVDTRVYVAVAAVGLLVVGIFGMRLFGSASQPEPPLSANIEVTQATIAPVEPVRASPTSPVIAEADIRAEEPATVLAEDRLTEVIAEAFVTDWYTRDGSPETVRSIRAALSASVASDALPHDEQDSPVTWVEWAKTITSETTSDGTELTIAYRAIRETDDGFVRDPVVAVLVSVVRNGDEIRVVALPLAVEG